MRLPSFVATIPANLDSLGQVCADLTFPVFASRKIARNRKGKFVSELSWLDSAAFSSRVTKVATTVLLSTNHRDVLGCNVVSRPRPTTKPSGALPTAARKSVLELAVIAPRAVSTGGTLGLLRKRANKKSTADEINKSMLPKTTREKCRKCELARPRTDGVVANP